MTDTNFNIINQCLAHYGKDLLNELSTHGVVNTLNANDYLVKQGEIARYLPIIIEGAIKVFSQEADMQFLLYYIHPGATCVFSFAHLFGDKKLNFSGVAEKQSKVLLIPVVKAREWLIKYPAFNQIILNEYQKRYDDLLNTTKQIICFNLEDRLIEHLNNKAVIMQTDTLTISHQNIATDMATSREVISRLLKKLEKDNRILQLGRKIKVL